MRIIFLILTFLFLLFGASPAFAAISFNISNPQQSGDEVTIDVSLSGLTSSSCPNSYCYLQAAFTSLGQTRYFGFTKNNSGQWYEYISSPSTTYIQSTFFAFQPTGGGWSGQITLKINPESSNYKDPGIYNIKAWRYTGNSSSGTAITSDVLSVNIQGSTPSPSPSPTSSPTPSPTSQTSTSSSFFTISNIPSQISSDQSFTISVSLSLFSSPNTTFYLKGAFKKADGSNYFGLTKVSGNWVKNGSSFANQYVITTDSSGNWSGNLEVQPDSEDYGFVGSGDYIFKVARYTSTGSGPTWSNEFMINIVSIESSDQGSSVLSTTSNNSSSTTNPSPSLSGKGKTTTSSQSKSYDKGVYHTASVAAATTSANSSVSAEVKSQQRINYFSWAGVLMIVGGTLVLTFVYLRNNNLRETIFNLFRKRN